MNTFDRRPLTRRTVLRAAGTLAGAGALTVAANDLSGNASGAPTAAFAHGVASGDPLADAVLIWTRITPFADATPGSGRGGPASLRWDVALDESFRQMVRSATVTTTAARDHTVTVDVTGLSPATRYFYRFTSLDGPTAGQVSPVGRTKTAPAPGAGVPALNFAFVSCANYEAGFFTAYRRLADHDEIDAVVALGDYIYEYPHNGYVGPKGAVRTVAPLHNVVRLADYRLRLATQRTDPDLQEAHRLHPWICTVDDHELTDNAYRDGATGDNPHDPTRDGPWQVRKRASFQAYTEWMPVRWSGNLDDPHLYRTLRFGSLADLTMLDLRTYRTRQPGLFSSAIDSPSATITGKAQLDHLINALTTSTARWQLVGNPVMLSPLLFPPFDANLTGALAEKIGLPHEGVVVNPDQWDGYSHDRATLFSAITRHNVRNPVFMTGDIHTSWANDLPLDAAAYPAGQTAGVEFVGPSVTANTIGETLYLPDGSLGFAVDALRGINRHVKWAQLDQHGFVLLNVTPARALATWHLLDDVTAPGGRTHVAARWQVRDGRRRIELP